MIPSLGLFGIGTEKGTGYFSARPRVVSEAETGPDAVGGHGRKIRLGNEAEGHHWRSNLEADEPFRQILGFPEVHPSVRSEEHTSELQSQSNLVCRLLLEKKKNENIDR